MQLSKEGLQLILDGEVGGGKTYYDKKCKCPIVPAPGSTSSGVTIGIGWDCGQNTIETLETEWNEYLSAEAISALTKVCGLKGMKAQGKLESVKDIEIEWDDALAQFQKYTVPRYWRSTCSAFPGVENAPLCVQETLLSLVFNRGTSMKDEDRRREMREIRDLVPDAKWKEISSKIRGMKRLWPGVAGLLARREQEARHIELGQVV